jgi:hypothetical protein
MRPPAAWPLSPSALPTMVPAADHYYIETEQGIRICSTVPNRETWMVKSGNVLRDVRFIFVHHGEVLIRLKIFTYALDTHPPFQYREIWKWKLPLKIKIFLWFL